MGRHAVACRHEVAGPLTTVGERRGPRLQRGGLPPALPRQPARPDAASSSTSSSSTTARPTTRAPSPTGTPPRSGRVRVVHTDNHGLGAARNEGLRHISGEYVGFADSDDVVPPAALRLSCSGRCRTRAPTSSPGRSSGGSPPASGAAVDAPAAPPGPRPAPPPPSTRRSWATCSRGTSCSAATFWEAAGLSWPEGIRYEDQPTTTRAYLAGRFDVLPDIVYHWRIRDDGTSITQQRASVADLADRLETKRMALASVDASPDADAVRPYFLDRVLAGDLHRYFLLIPGCSDEWWDLLESGVRELWGDRSLVHSGLPPVHRLTGWLVEQGRREDAATVMSVRRRAGRSAAPRVEHRRGRRPDRRAGYRPGDRRPRRPRGARPRGEAESPEQALRPPGTSARRPPGSPGRR